MKKLFEFLVVYALGLLVVLIIEFFVNLKRQLSWNKFVRDEILSVKKDENDS